MLRIASRNAVLHAASEIDSRVVSCAICGENLVEVVARANSVRTAASSTTPLTHCCLTPQPAARSCPQYAMQKRLFYGCYIAITSNAAEKGLETLVSGPPGIFAESPRFASLSKG